MDDKVKIYIRTYPRSGTHLLSTLIHYRYGFSQMTPTFVKPITNGKDNLEMYTAHYGETESWGINGRIYVLRNPLDCISSQYYRRFKPEVTSLDREKFQESSKSKDHCYPWTHNHSGAFEPSVWNEVGAYNEMVKSIDSNDLVLYFEDLLHSPEKVIQSLDSYFLTRFNLNTIDSPKTFEEIKEISFLYYNKEHKALSHSHHDTNNHQKLKALIEPYVDKFLYKSNPHLSYYYS